MSPLYGETEQLKSKVAAYESSISLYEKEVNQRFINFEQ